MGRKSQVEVIQVKHGVFVRADFALCFASPPPRFSCRQLALPSYRVAASEMVFPWQIDDADLQGIAKSYPSEKVSLAIESLEARRYSGFKVPCVFMSVDITIRLEIRNHS